jgi:hypothetical protein
LRCSLPAPCWLHLAAAVTEAAEAMEVVEAAEVVEAEVAASAEVAEAVVEVALVA